MTYYDTLVSIVPNTQPVAIGAGGRIRLKQLDPKALYVEPNTAPFNCFAALSKNNYLLFPYESGRYDYKNRLVLAHIITTPGPFSPIYGDNWQITAGGPDLRSATVHAVGDSLVVMTHLYGGGRLYTLNLSLARQKWHLRQLKDDGLNQTAINDLQTWGDTVYLATSSGLFKRPLNTFFESKPKP